MGEVVQLNLYRNIRRTRENIVKAEEAYAQALSAFPFDNPLFVQYGDYIRSQKLNLSRLLEEAGIKE